MIDIRQYGKQIEPPLSELVAAEILYEFEGPRIFSVASDLGLLLAYVVRDEFEFQVVLLCPTTSELLHDLVAGKATVREILEHSWTWLAEVAWDGKLRAVVNVSTVLPDEFLPRREAMLYHSLQPLLSVKLEGKDLTATNVRASVVKQAVEAGTVAIKRIVDYIWDATPEGRPKNILRVLSDLPAQRFVFGSFQVDFGRPEISQMTLDDRDINNNLERIGNELQHLVSWITDQDSDNETNGGLDIQLLKALERLVPPLNGQVEKIEISGSLFGDAKLRTITRKSTQKLRTALKRFEQEQVLLSYSGRIRELDKDDLTFTLRDLQEVTERNEVICSFERDLLEAVFEHFTEDNLVRISGRQLKNDFEMSDLSIFLPQETPKEIPGTQS